MNKLVKNTTIYALGDILPRLLSFISFPILTSYLSPAEYGIINYVNTISLFVTAIGFLCLNTYYLVYYYKLENDIEREKLLGNLTIFVVLFNLILSIGLFTFGNNIFFALESNISFYPYIAIGVATCFFNVFSVLPSALFRLKENPLPLTIINVLRGLITFAITLVLVIKFNFKAEGVLYSTLFVSFIFAFFYIYITYKNMIFNINWKQIKTALLFSLPLLPGTLSYYLISMSDRIFIDKYLSLSSLGIYSTASTLALLLNIVSSGSYKAFEPHFFKIYGSDRFDQDFIKVRDYFFATILLCALGIALFAKEFFYFFTNKQYFDAYLYVPLILVGVTVSSLSLLYGTIITARGKTTINSAITICGGIISVTCNILLLPKIGLLGACLSSALTMSLILIANIYFSKVNNAHFLRLIILSILAFIITYLLVYCINISSIILMIGLKTVTLILFLIILKTVLRIKISIYGRSF